MHVLIGLLGIGWTMHWIHFHLVNPFLMRFYRCIVVLSSKSFSHAQRVAESHPNTLGFSRTISFLASPILSTNRGVFGYIGYKLDIGWTTIFQTHIRLQCANNKRLASHTSGFLKLITNFRSLSSKIVQLVHSVWIFQLA